MAIGLKKPIPDGDCDPDADSEWLYLLNSSKNLILKTKSTRDQHYELTDLSNFCRLTGRAIGSLNELAYPLFRAGRLPEGDPNPAADQLAASSVYEIPELQTNAYLVAEPIVHSSSEIDKSPIAVADTKRTAPGDKR